MADASSVASSTTMIGMSEAARVLQALGICKAFGPSGRINGPNCQRFGRRDPSTGRWAWSVPELIAQARQGGSAVTEDIERIAKQYGLPASPTPDRDEPDPETTRPESSPTQPDKGPCRTLHLEDLLRDLNVYLVDLLALLNSPRHKFCSLVESHVPEAAGLYVIYRDDPPETLYVGKADDLRFRIMKNHLAYKGDDNFVKYLMQDLALTSRSVARAYIRRQCSTHWVEVDDPQRLFILEHLAIAAARPRYNRG